MTKGGITRDRGGNIYISGTTFSTDLPAATNTYGGGTTDAFVTKLSSTGSVLFSTYVGGSGTDQGRDITRDGSGNIYITGITLSTNLPAATNAFGGGYSDAFVTKIIVDPSISVDPLMLTLAPNTFSEAAGANAAVGIVTRSEDTSQALAVTLSSSNPNAATVPASIEIPAGQTSATFAIAAVDNLAVDGSKEVTITAIDTEIAPVMANATVTDNDGADIAITPLSGLVTTEAGGQSTFTVVLTSQPTANVAIPLSSSHPREGTVAPEALTFTPQNWNQAQTVTVTGVDDSIIDGNQAYTIVTAPAQSSDANYNERAADVAVTNVDNEPTALGLTLSASSTLEGGAVTATLTRLSTLLDSEMTVTLTSSDPSLAAVPATVTIPGGATTVQFPVQSIEVNDAVASGARSATISATYNTLSASQVLTVEDNDVAALTLSLAAPAVTEGSSLIGRVTRNTSLSETLSVALQSNSASVRVPPSVLIGVGSTFAEFTITAPENSAVEGNRGAIITASTATLSDSKTITVQDNETPQLTLTIAPSRIAENGTATATLTRNSEITAATPSLTVTVTPDTAGPLTHPQTVIIPARAARVSFVIKAVDNTIADGPRTITLTARATGFAAAAAQITVTDNEAASAGSISGKVLLPKTQKSLPIRAVTLTLRRGRALLDTTTSAPDGSYRFRGLPAGSYTVTPAKIGYGFLPTSLSVSLTTRSMAPTNIHFTALVQLSISGRVKRRNADGSYSGVGRVYVFARGVTTDLTYLTRTDNAGFYKLERVSLATYFVAPDLAGTFFFPRLRHIALTVARPHVAEVNFVMSGGDTLTPTVTVDAPDLRDLVVTGTNSDKGEARVSFVTAALARFSSASATTPQAFWVWKDSRWISTDDGTYVERTGVQNLQRTTWKVDRLPALPPGFYGIRATAVDGASNRGRSPWKRFRITAPVVRATTGDTEEGGVAPTSLVRLSSAQASVSSIVLQFTGALDSSDATALANYQVRVNGQIIEVESLSYGSSIVTLGLPEGLVQTGDSIQVTWQELRDAQQRLLPTATQQLTVR